MSSHKNMAAYTFLFLLWLMPSTSIAATIEGRLFSEAVPLKGAKVYVYKSYGDVKTGAACATSDASDELGMYKLQLPEGEYYFTAKGIRDGKDFFSYLGANPVKVNRENIWLTMIAHESKPPVYSDGVVSLRGVVTYKGEPLKDAYVALYKSEDRRFRGRGFRTEAVEDDGTFNLNVLPGEYVVIARKMEGDGRIRPLKSGDLYCYYPQNPVQVRSGKIVRIEVPCSPKGERTSYTEGPVLKTNDYLTVENLMKENKFGIKGRVTYVTGKPVKGVYMIAYRGDPASPFVNYDEIQAIENIGKTDENGNYFISLTSDGFVRLVVRSALGARPKTRELFNLYNGSPDHGVDFKKGQIIDHIDMVIEENRTEGDRR